MDRIKNVNDFVIRFANVNGSGSASANNLFARAVFRSGVHVSPKNIFPSNIQGLPTWYEIRVSDRGYLGRRGGYDFAVAVNPKSLVQDYLDLAQDGYFLYDSDKELPEECEREDVVVLGVPLTTLCKENFTDMKLRQLMRNIIYVGALTYFLDIDFSILTDSITKQFEKKPAIAEPNILALELGYSYAKAHYPRRTCRLSIEKSRATRDSIIIDGNSAAGLGALYGGATVTGWYPITPSTSVIESFASYCKRFRVDTTGRNNVAIVQAEDELAAMGIVIGAAWNGARAFTATSGPGLSLMSEFLGLAYFAEIPAVVIDVQRAGPSTGMPTRSQQADLLSAAYASHGDTRHPLLLPCNPFECFTMTAQAFDLAERLQTPVLVMSDLDLGMNDHVCEPLVWDDSHRYDRGKVLSAKDLEKRRERWGRYLDEDGDGICSRTYPGTHPTLGSYFTRGTSHDEYSDYSEQPEIYEENMRRLQRKWETAKAMIPEPHAAFRDPENQLGVLFYGTTTHAAYEAIGRFAAKGIKMNTMRLRGFPFRQEVIDFIKDHRRIFLIEQNRDAQMKTLLINETGVVPDKVESVLNYDGLPISVAFIEKQLGRIL